MSPVPGRSTLITSAPNHASSWVQVGPAWTWLRSRMRTPSSALPAPPHGFVEGRRRPLAGTAAFFGASFTTFLADFLADFFAAALVLGLLFLRVAIVVPLDESPTDAADLFLANHALRVEVADAAALGAGRRIDHRIDKGRLTGVHRLVHGATQLIGRCHMGANAAECFRNLVVARVFDEDGCRSVRTASRIDVGSAVDAGVVEDDNADRQLVPADRFHFHAAETKGAVAFHREHGFAGLHGGCDGKAHADAHDTPGADIQAFARLIHVDDAAREIERVGAFVDEDGIRPLFDDGAQCTECAVVVHRRRVLHQPRRHLGDVFFLLRFDGADPVGRRRRPLAAHTLEKRGYAGADVADQRSDDLDIAVHLLGLNVDLDELLRSKLAPSLALAVRQQPVEAGADQHHDIGVFQHRRARRTRRLRMRVGQEALAMLIARKGMPLFSTRARISSSTCAYAAPLPRMIRGRLAVFNTSSARLTAAGAGIWAGAGSMTLTSDFAPASASIT